MRGKTLQIFTLILTVSLALSACSKRLETHGSIVKPSQFENIQVGSHNKDDVASILGSPSTIGTFNDNRWYYYTEKTSVKPLSRQEVLERDIVVIDFNKNNVVSALSFKTKADGKNIEPSSKTTATHGQTMGVIDQVIDNVSRGL